MLVLFLEHIKYSIKNLYNTIQYNLPAVSCDIMVFPHTTRNSFDPNSPRPTPSSTCSIVKRFHRETHLIVLASTIHLQTTLRSSHDIIIYAVGKHDNDIIIIS
uniref:Uncharacterized protein n=1 Tax=Schizaphis graminum TaxID=13262 RepID=A0A2S2PU79_SCHGA